jgi:hypothetical protein
MDRVRRAVDEAVLVRIAEIEDVVGDDADLADQGAGGLQLFERGQGRGRLRGGQARMQEQGDEPEFTKPGFRETPRTTTFLVVQG